MMQRPSTTGKIMQLAPEPTSSEISALKRRDTGQLALALAAADSNAVCVIPGIRAARSRWILEMVQPASSFSSETVAVTLMLSGVKFMVLSCAERAMAKQPAWAAPINSSGFVPLAFSKRVRKE